MYYFDCGQCGHIGPVSELKNHPTRPVAMDIGFCPECGREIEYLITKEEADEIIASYDE